MTDNSSVIELITPDMLTSKIKTKSITNRKISLQSNEKDKQTKCLTEKINSKSGQHNLIKDKPGHSITENDVNYEKQNVFTVSEIVLALPIYLRFHKNN